MDLEMSQKKSKTMHMHFFFGGGGGGWGEEVYYGICASGELMMQQDGGVKWITKFIPFFVYI